MSGLDEVAADLAREQLRAGNPLRTQASGVSMWPLVRDGDWVVVQPCPPGALRVGDVVLVAAGRRLVLHRVIGRVGSEVLLKGDACSRPDGWVPVDQVLGRLGPRAWDPLAAQLSPVGGRWLDRARRALELTLRDP